MLPWSDTLYGVVKNGVPTLSGYSISVREDNGFLLIRDGLKGKRSVKSACREASVRAMIAACEQQQRKCPLAA